MADGKDIMLVRGMAVVRKWGVGRDPERDPPDEVEISAQWIEGGIEVTDPQRIVELEALANEQDGNS